MILLAATTTTLELITGNAGNVDVNASYVDIAATPSFVPAPQNTNILLATTTTIVSAPAAATQRQVKMLYITNKDKVAQAVTLQTNSNGVIRVLLNAIVLAAGETLQYVDGQGVTVLDPFAQRKAVNKATIANPPTFTLPWAVSNNDLNNLVAMMLMEMRIQNFLLVNAFGLDIDVEQLRNEKDFNINP